MDRTAYQNQKLSSGRKNANGKRWYKDMANYLDAQADNIRSSTAGEISEYKRMKVNYDLFNNILNTADLEYVCQPYGAEVGELPATMTNRDIASGKIKALLGMEMKRPFNWNIIATNPEATTRREQKETSLIKDFVVQTVMQPIREKIMMEAQSQMQNVPPEQQEQAMAQMQQEVEGRVKAMTPAEVKRYMERDHQDPAEIASTQLLEYLIQKTDIKRKFNDGFKHMNLVAKEIYYVGIENGDPQIWVVNPIRFNTDMSPDHQFIEDGEWATCEYRMTRSEVVRYFSKELTDKEIDKIYKDYDMQAYTGIREHDFNFGADEEEDESGTIRVLHCTWKSLRQIKFLTYTDLEGVVQTTIVHENYKLNKDAGDIKTESEWIVEVYETWKIGTDIYVRMQPIPGQFKDLDNIYNASLPYCGAITDNMNSAPTSIMDRLKVYQYYYNIIMYRIELLIATDKGKKIMMDIGSVPSSAGFDLKKWQYFFESTPFVWYDNKEEGNQDQNLGRTVDLSLASDINNYINLAMFIKKQAGDSIGVTDQVEGQIGPNESVGNTKQSLVQSSHILEPYFELHNNVKKRVLTRLIETAKVAYHGSDRKAINYVLDDMSVRTLNVDMGLLENNTLGIFITNAAKAEENKDMIQQLAHAAMQNQKVELSDIISIIREEDFSYAEEKLKVAEKDRMEREQQAQQSQQQAQAEEAEKNRQFEREKHEMEIEKIRVKEQERRETEIIKGSLVGYSFNPDTDKDKDGINDFLEVARNGLDADVKAKQIQLDRDKFEHQKEVDKKKLENEEKKINNDKEKESKKLKARKAGNTA